jgi:hypothetical protein
VVPPPSLSPAKQLLEAFRLKQQRLMGQQTQQQQQKVDAHCWIKIERKPGEASTYYNFPISWEFVIHSPPPPFSLLQSKLLSHTKKYKKMYSVTVALIKTSFWMCALKLTVFDDCKLFKLRKFKCFKKRKNVIHQDQAVLFN